MCSNAKLRSWTTGLSPKRAPKSRPHFWLVHIELLWFIEMLHSVTTRPCNICKQPSFVLAISTKKTTEISYSKPPKVLRLSSSSFFSFPFSVQKYIVLYAIKGPTSFKRSPNPGYLTGASLTLSHGGCHMCVVFFLETTQPKSYVRGIFDGAGLIIAPVTIWSFLTIFLWGVESHHPSTENGIRGLLRTYVYWSYAFIYTITAIFKTNVYRNMRSKVV